MDHNDKAPFVIAYIAVAFSGFLVGALVVFICCV